MFEFENVSLFKTESDSQMSLSNLLNGSALNDSMIASDIAESLLGFAGDDTMLAAGGDDWLHGNKGRDWLNGNQGDDTAYGGQDSDTMYGGQDNDILSGNKSSDWLNGNQQDDTIYGGQDNDILHGGQGNDLIFGDEGDDTIYGDKGSDTLTGGNGRDVFAFASLTGSSSSNSADVIVDFNPSQDQIQLVNGLTFDDLSLSDTGNGVTIQVAETGEVLAVVEGVDTADLQRDTFISLSDDSLPEPEDLAGNTLATARNTNLTETPQTVSDFVGDSDLVDLYKFEIDGLSRINLKLDGLSADADILLLQDLNNDGVLDEEELLEAPFETDNTTEALDRILEAGTYFIQVEQFSGETTYTLEFSGETLEEIPEDLAGHTLAEARNLTITETPQTISDFIGDLDLIDLYKFEITQNSQINVTLGGLSADADLTLIQDLNNNGEIDFDEFLDSSSESDNNSEQLNTILEAGIYFIEVEQFEGDTTYTLEFSAEQTDELPEDLAGEIPADARSLDVTETPQIVSHFVRDLDPIDLYQFELDQATILNAKLDGMTADADLLLYQDSDGDGELGPDEVVSVSEQAGTVDESIENITLDSGTYFLAVEQFEGDTNYNLSVAGVAGTIATDLAGDGPSSARVLPLNGTVELYDYLGETDAVDTYRFEVQNGGYLDLLAIGKDGNLELTLWSDLNGNNQLDDDETIIQETDAIFLNSIESGTYFVNVTAPAGATSYGISAISQPGSSVENERYKPLFPNSSFTGILDEDDFIEARGESADPYLLSFVEPGLTVQIDKTSEDFDPSLTVVDLVTGDTIATNDSTEGGDPNAQVSFTAEEGKKYVVYASSKSAGSGEYNLKTTVTGTPTPTNNVSPSLGSTTETPEPIFRETDSNNKVKNEYNFTYQPLTGGKVEDDLIRIRDVNQGYFGNCYFIAGLAATFGKIEPNLSNANSKESVVLQSNINPGDNNSYNFVLYKGTEKKEYSVDNQVITSGGELFGAQWQKSGSQLKPTDASNQSIWASLYERAYALGYGGYTAIGNGGAEGAVLVELTGKKDNLTMFSLKSGSSNFQQYQSVTFSDNSSFSFREKNSVKPEDVFKSIQTTLNGGGYAGAGTKTLATNTKGDKDTLYNGVLSQGHAYSIHNAYENEAGQKLILLRNPWGVDNDKGVFAKEDPNKDSQDGFITITFDAFIDNFDGLNLLKA